MQSRPRGIRVYSDERGLEPFTIWLDKLDDELARATVRVRIARLEAGNPGDYRNVGAGVKELRIHFGPGLRVYFAEYGNSLVLLLGGGNKRTQVQDIKKAKACWDEAKETL